MRLFLDTANLDEIGRAADLGLIDGVTTNPSHIAKEGRGFREQIERICSRVPGEVSAEVVSTGVRAGDLPASGRRARGGEPVRPARRRLATVGGRPGRGTCRI